MVFPNSSIFHPHIVPYLHKSKVTSKMHTHVIGSSQVENSVVSSAAMKTTAESAGVGIGTAEVSTEPGTGPANINIATATGNQATENGRGNTSSCIIELRTVWFNFAAPPRAPITRKIDFTR